jgi:hypothetical protein
LAAGDGQEIAILLPLRFAHVGPLHRLLLVK